MTCTWVTHRVWGGHAPPPVSISATPNPFSGSTRVDYSLESPGRVRLSVYDVAGRRIAQLDEGRKSPGAYTALWDDRDDGGRSVASGVYFCVLQQAGVKQTRKMVLIRQGRRFTRTDGSMSMARKPVGACELRGRGISDGQRSPERAVRVVVFSTDLNAERPRAGHCDGCAPREREVAAYGLLIDCQELFSVSEETQEGVCLIPGMKARVDPVEGHDPRRWNRDLERGRSERDAAYAMTVGDVVAESRGCRLAAGRIYRGRSIEDATIGLVFHRVGSGEEVDVRGRGRRRDDGLVIIRASERGEDGYRCKQENEQSKSAEIRGHDELLSGDLPP